MIREVFFFELGIYMLNNAYGIKEANKETQKNWISLVQKNAFSEYLDASYEKLYPESSETGGVHFMLVWDDIRKINMLNAVTILSHIEEVGWDMEEDLEEKATIYLMNEYAREHPNKFIMSK